MTASWIVIVKFAYFHHLIFSFFLGYIYTLHQWNKHWFKSTCANLGYCKIVESKSIGRQVHRNYSQQYWRENCCLLSQCSYNLWDASPWRIHNAMAHSQSPHQQIWWLEFTRTNFTRTDAIHCFEHRIDHRRFRNECLWHAQKLVIKSLTIIIV